MPKKSKPKQQITSKVRPKVFTFTRSNLLVSALFMITFAVIGVFFLFSSEAAPKQRCCTVPTIYFSSDSSSVRVGSTFTTEVWVDSLGVEINAVQANFSYPAANMEFVRFEERSGFEVQAQLDASNGQVRIARGSTTIATGKSLVAAVTFKATSSNRKAKLVFLPETAAAGPGSNFENVLQKMLTATYSIR